MAEERNLSRRTFLRWSAGAAAGTALSQVLSFEPWHLEATEPVRVADPLTIFPNRDWERVYRDLFRPDSEFVFTCAPNDTHDCLLRASVKNGVVVRIHQTYGYGKAQDLYGNTASHRWDPRGCQKGLALARKFYGDRRVQAPMVRKGWKDWADGGFQRDADGKPRMDTTKRGEDQWLKVSWDVALDLAAKAYVNTATTFAGPQGAELLRKQGYDPDMISSMEEAGTKALKVRGGMPLLGITRIFGFNRFINMMALLDAHVRKVGPDKAKGGRGLDSYSWHTDLPPGHPMVTGHQTVEFELFAPEHSDLVVTFGMNWISTKMPDGHWLAEARQKGTKIITVTTDYQSTSNRADEVILTRPGVDSALALGCVQHILANNLYDERNVKNFTDLPLLVRSDDKKLLSAADVIPNYQPASLDNYVQVVPAGQGMPAPNMQGTVFLPQALRQQWGDFVVWDTRTNQPAAVTRDQVGDRFSIDPALAGEFDVRLVSGQTIKAQTVFGVIKKYLDDNFTPEQTSEITWAKKEAIESLARQIAAAKGRTLLTTGMGPNHYFNNDLFGRAILLLGAVTDNVGHIGGNVGAYAGNYRGSVFNGIAPQWVNEDPFDQELDPSRPARTKSYYKTESAHYYNYGDRPQRIGNKNFTGASHMPTPTKLLHFGNSNSLLGNSKWHHDLVHNTLPKIDSIFIQEWWWTASCEYADIVFPVDSWAEFKHVDASASCTNPFLHMFPRSPLKRIHDTRSDIEVFEGIAQKLTAITSDQRFANHWKFVTDNRTDVYLQRIFDSSSTTRGYRVDELERLAQQGIPAIMNSRTYPRQVGWEQRFESKPWYNRTGRLEFYRDEPEFIEHGENLPVHREPIDSTYYEPNVILAKPHPLIQPQGPQAYGLKLDDLSSETRQVRNVVKSWAELKVTKHPLAAKDPNFKFVFITPKYRHGAHTTPVDLDWMSYMFGPFADMYRHDRRMPWVGEGYLEMNPADARALGIEDGDYIWFDADPEDRPYRGWKKDDPDYEVSRGMARARYTNAMQPGVTRMWFHMFVATKGSVRGQKERPDGLAKNPDTNYQSHFRHGSHQSGTRAWLKPTLQTETLVRKPYFGQTMGVGFEGDVHSVVGAPKESFIKIEKAEDGGINGNGKWRPVTRGLRPGSESEVMKKYLSGGFYESDPAQQVG
jgi:nitrate reductase alpha subunit